MGGAYKVGCLPTDSNRRVSTQIVRSLFMPAALFLIFAVAMCHVPFAGIPLSANAAESLNGDVQIRRPGQSSQVYGVDPLRPSPESLLGRYLAESGAYSFPRAFPVEKDGSPGPARLVVAVSEASFPIFEKFFSGKSFLYLFHEPHQRILTAAFNGGRGTEARLEDSFRFTESGVMLIPLLLTPGESRRAELFFDLALRAPRKFDVALFPWLLTDTNGGPYTEPRQGHLLSEWFMRMPIGEQFDESRKHEPYSVDKLDSAVRGLVQEVWTAPYGHLSLGQLLDLRMADPKRESVTPGLIAASLLGSAGLDRVPVLFRFVKDHAAPLEHDFNTWIDTDFIPPSTAPEPPLAGVHENLRGHDLFNPSVGSLLRAYLDETNAATVIRRFPTAPAGNRYPPPELGPEKLVVAVSPQTFGVFKKYFTSRNFLYLFYEPNSGMIASFEGKRGNLMLRDKLRYTTRGTLMVPILLDEDEGARAALFFKLAGKSSTVGVAQNPWLLHDAGMSYSAQSAYQGCTHWFGSIPIGDKKVDAYFFPSGDSDVQGNSPNHQELMSYDTSGFSDEDAELIRQVWQVPGFQQLGELLNRKAHRRGELTNAGWIAYSLLGSVDVDRTPVAFLLVNDERTPIPADFRLQIIAE